MTDIEELKKLDELKTKVLKYIMFKKRTEKEIRRKFGNVEDQDLLENVIENLKEIGYINDNSYIERAVAEFTNLKNLSLKELKYKLLTKGLNKDLVDDYFFSNMDKLEEFEINSAKNIILKKSGNSDEQEIIQYLLKKGYKMELVKQAIEIIKE